MLKIQHHRGPDGQGQWWSPKARVGLCHNRLAIIDLSSAGAQPMHSTDGRFVIVYNGELYNFRDLRAKLENIGARFHSHSDTEVLLESYRAWGENMLVQLRGMFSFALYDNQTETLLCARDRLGKKPFVYTEGSFGFAFASEIPAIRTLLNGNISLDHAALGAMLLHNLRHIPDPYTAFRNIYRLRPGHAMRVRNGRIERLWRYWEPKPSSEPISPENLRLLVDEAVRLRLQSDVPVGALLSGGVDSSAIVALMRQHADVPVRTYALGLDIHDEDLRRARTMATHLGTDHKEFYFDPDEQWATFKILLEYYGEPIMLLPLLHTYSLCHAIYLDGVKVVLSGNGADELFYGYSGHLRTLRVSRWLNRVAPFRSMLAALIPRSLSWVTAPTGRRKAAYYQALAQSEWSRCLTPQARTGLANRAAEELAYWGSLCPSREFIDESNFVGLLVENAHSVTIAGDLPAMAASVEMRCPFLDQDVVSFALATPSDRKITGSHNPNRLKAILREAVANLVPAELLNAPKRGFGMAIQEEMAFRGPWRSNAEQMFSTPDDAEGLFDTHVLKRTWMNFLAARESTIRIARLFAMQLWLKECITSDASKTASKAV